MGKLKCKIHAVINDLHLPFGHRNAMRIMWQVLTEVQPNVIHVLGDLVDFYQLSRYDKDPQRITCVQADLDGAHGFLEKLRDTFPKSEIIFSAGNHEQRLHKMLQRTTAASPLATLRALSLPELFRLAPIRVGYRADGEAYRVGNLTLVHGDLIRQHSAYTAKCLVDLVGGSVLCGHTHRGGVYYRTTWNGTWVGYENFCLCDFNLGYGYGRPNWQHGMSLLYQFGDQVQVTPVPFLSC